VDALIVPIPVQALLGALARAPRAFGRGLARDEVPPLARTEQALGAFLEELARDRLLQPGPHPELGAEIRFPPPPRDVAFRRLLLAAAAVVADPAVAPAVRMALATAGPKGVHLYRRLATVAEGMVMHVDPAAPWEDPARAEEVARRVAAAFRLTIQGEADRESLARLSAVDAKAEAERAREEARRSREEAARRALEAAARRIEPWRLMPE
jgi:hypothetical protein